MPVPAGVRSVRDPSDLAPPKLVDTPGRIKQINALAPVISVTPSNPSALHLASTERLRITYSPRLYAWTQSAPSFSFILYPRGYLGCRWRGLTASDPLSHGPRQAQLPLSACCSDQHARHAEQLATQARWRLPRGAEAEPRAALRGTRRTRHYAAGPSGARCTRTSASIAVRSSSGLCTWRRTRSFFSTPRPGRPRRSATTSDGVYSTAGSCGPP